jgi:hypothetical protein
LVKDVLAKSNATTLEHPPYSPDLGPADFYLFPRPKSALKGRRFCDITDFIKNATEELTEAPPNGFQESYHHLDSRWQKYIVAHGDYLDGNVA